MLDTAAWQWMNWPISAVRAENKLYQLMRAQEIGFTIPETLFANDPDTIRAFVRNSNNVAKTVVGGRLYRAGKEQVIYTTSVRF